MTRIPALDGLRGTAILLVVGYHAWPALFPGGSHGVTLFFVLSGFLITRLLVAEMDQDGRLRLGAFYWRRALRLLPALLLISAVFLIAGGPWDSVWRALTYTSNFHAVDGGSIYPLQHTWSLAIEEHFYLVWPFVIALARRHRVFWVGSLLAVSVLWRGGLLASGASWERIYYATDAVAFALLAGCTLAVVDWRPRYPVAALAAFCAGALLFDTYSHEYLWSSFPMVALSVVLVGSAESVGWLRAPWLIWLGRRSYAIYLWHPVLLASLPAGVALGTTGLVAEASWRLIERPALALRNQTLIPKRSARYVKASSRSPELSTWS